MGDDYGPPPPDNPYTSPQSPGWQPPPGQAASSTLGIISLLTGLLSLASLPFVLCCFVLAPLGIVSLALSITSILCGWFGYRRAPRGTAAYNLAVAGLVCGAITLALILAIIAVGVIAVWLSE